MDAEIKGIGPFLQLMQESFQRGEKLQLQGAGASFQQLSVLSAALSGEPRLVVVLNHPKEAASWLSFLEAHLNSTGAPLQACFLPQLSLWGHDRFINPLLQRRQRLKCLGLYAFSKEPLVIVTTLGGLLEQTIPMQEFINASLTLRVGMTLDQDAFLTQLDNLGYLAAPSVEEEMTYAAKGAVVDVFSPHLDAPLRLQFSDDELVSIRHFTLSDQRSKESLHEAHIIPADECVLSSEERRQSVQRIYQFLLDHGTNKQDLDGFMEGLHAVRRPPGFDVVLPQFRPRSESFLQCAASATFFLSVPDSFLFSSWKTSLSDYLEDYQSDREEKKITLSPEDFFLPTSAAEQVFAALARRVDFGAVFTTGKHPAAVKHFLPPEFLTILRGSGERFEKILRLISAAAAENVDTCFVVSSKEQSDRLISLLAHRGKTPISDDNFWQKISSRHQHQLVITQGYLEEILFLDDIRTILIPESEIFGAAPKRPKKASAKLQSFLGSFKDLKTGDLVVHLHHGIGRYRGMQTLKLAGHTGDFLHIEYAGADKIYLPIDKLGLLQKYSSSGDAGSSFALDKLGSGQWEKRTSKVRKAVRDMSEQLLKLHAQRALAPAARMGSPADSYFQFEAEFPFEETEDQLRAIADVQNDLSAGRAMDRLVCGDVGFGKTEVALRATMRVVLEGYQVIILVPTTVLCYQHFRTFSARLEKFGVRVAQLNRFIDSKTTTTTLQNLASGRVDVVIGTHRILSKDIKAARLGLLIVDEEQRFGVVHKERIKELKVGTHILTLTATPIPRTLHMAMIGLRDICIISTPPEKRLPVKVYISRFDESLIREAIEREIKRGGQVFFLHNRVEDIDEVCTFLRSLLPGVSFKTAHGQMREHQLEETILEFIEQKFSVLVCTTIIESGIDMPNVNTLIVNQADRFGLAQLYQIKGRVGRSTAQAYAYFFTKNEEQLTDDAKKRLEVLSTFQELGAGFQIASHDLEIRGAGNLLGGEQSGHASEVGLELYTEMLEAEIASLRGQERPPTVDPELKLQVTALIPPTYIQQENARLHIYKSLFSVEAVAELESIRQDMMDQYGPYPVEVERLFKVARIKWLLRQINCSFIGVNTKENSLEIKFAHLNAEMVDRLIKSVSKEPQFYRLSPDYKLYIQLSSPAGSLQEEELLDAVLKLVGPIVDEMALLNQS